MTACVISNYTEDLKKISIASNILKIYTKFRAVDIIYYWYFNLTHKI